MVKLEKLKILTNQAAEDQVLSLLLDQAESEFLQYTNREELPLDADNLIVDMAIVKLNLMGAEGLASQSFSGSSETYGNYPPQLISAMNHYRKLRVL